MIQRIVVALFLATLLVQPVLGQQENKEGTKTTPADAEPSQPDAQPTPAQPATSEPKSPARDSQPDTANSASTAAPASAAVPSAAPTLAPVNAAAAPATQPPGNEEHRKQLTEIRDQLATLKKQNWIKDLGPSTVALFAIIVSSIISVKSLNRNATLARDALQSKAHEEERRAIREKRDRFYGPFTQLRGVSKHLYEIFNARRSEDERKKFSDSEGNFRTLIALCRGHEFKDDVDKVLLAEIIRIGEDSASLITKEIGLVDNPTLQTELSRAATHYRIIKLAAEGKLRTDGDEFKKFSFPKEVDKLIEAQIATLDARLRELEHVFGSTQPAANKAGKST